MRTYSIALHTLSVVGTVLLFPSLFVTACGSEADGESTSSSSKSGEQPAPQVFTSEFAGDTCAEDKDCGNGRCATRFTDALFGGSQQAPGGYCTFSCKLDADCGEAACIGANNGAFGLGGNTGASSSGQCLLRCRSSAECRDGYRCFNAVGQALEGEGVDASAASGTCQIAPETDSVDDGVTGNACTQDSDCGGGRCMASDLLMTTYPDGYCTGSCLANGDCGAGGVCATAFGGMAGTCYRGCEQDADCARDGYRCRGAAFPQGGSMRCLPGADPLPDGVVGTACAQDADCGGSLGASCRLTLPSTNGDVSAPAGYCSVSCVDDLDCGAGGSCIGSFGGITMGTCYKVCTDEAECRDAYACEMPSLAGFGNAGNFGGFMGAMGMGTGMLPTVCTVSQGADDQDAGVP